MHTFHFHSTLIDDQNSLLEYTSDLSLFCWYQDLFKRLFAESLNSPTMTRYSGCFPAICSHFSSCRHELCPEEFTMLRSRSLTLARSFLEKMALEGKKLLIHLYNQKIALADKLYPEKAAQLIIASESEEKTKKKKRRNKKSNQAGNQQSTMPGAESHRRDRVRNPSEPRSDLDQAEYQVCELSCALASHKEINIWGHLFSPKEFFHEVLEKQFAKVIIKFIKVDAANHMIERPTVSLNRVSF